jgi:DNA-binding PadR family transcriptional regulator
MGRKRENLGNFELMVLLALMRVRDDAYGLPILQEIESRIAREVSLGSVYAALARLETKGFVTSRLGEPTAARGGKAKRYFKVTSSGVREVRGVRRALVSLWQGLSQTTRGAIA